MNKKYINNQIILSETFLIYFSLCIQQFWFIGGSSGWFSDHNIGTRVLFASTKTFTLNQANFDIWSRQNPLGSYVDDYAEGRTDVPFSNTANVPAGSFRIGAS